MCLVGATESHYGATTFMFVVENDRICRRSAVSVGEGGRVSAKAMRRPVPAAVVQRRTKQSLVSTMPAQCFIRPNIQRSPQYTVHAAQAHSALTWFSPPVEAVARGVAVEQSPATWSHSWALLSGHTPGNRLDRRAKPGEGALCAVPCAQGLRIPLDGRSDGTLRRHRRDVSPSSSSPSRHPTRSHQTGRVSPLTLAAWNVRSLLDNPRSKRLERRTALVARELARYKVDIAALSETRFPEEGQLEEAGVGYTFFWSGRPKAE
nr:unnamed protein product [Spirometra erinaceieuropaei]